MHVKTDAASSVDREYRRHRRSVYAGIFAGYAAYYLVRNNLALAIPDILAAYPQHSKADLGWALTGSSIAYGVSKFLMGSVSDRTNPKYFLPLGLLLSCGIVFVSGFAKAIYASLALVIVLQIANGWVQGMGWPPCDKTMVHWFSTRAAFVGPARLWRQRQHQRRAEAQQAIGDGAHSRTGHRGPVQPHHHETNLSISSYFRQFLRRRAVGNQRLGLQSVRHHRHQFLHALVCARSAVRFDTCKIQPRGQTTLHRLDHMGQNQAHSQGLRQATGDLHLMARRRR